jgi:hypothetical protein
VTGCLVGWIWFHLTTLSGAPSGGHECDEEQDEQQKPEILHEMEGQARHAQHSEQVDVGTRIHGVLLEEPSQCENDRDANHGEGEDLETVSHRCEVRWQGRGRR